PRSADDRNLVVLLVAAHSNLAVGERGGRGKVAAPPELGTEVPDHVAVLIGLPQLALDDEGVLPLRLVGGISDHPEPRFRARRGAGREDGGDKGRYHSRKYQPAHAIPPTC